MENMKGFRVSSLAYKIAMPYEDAFRFSLSNLSMAVADGITRDPCDYLPDLNSFFGKIRWIWSYPRPSPAGVAAEIFVVTFNELVNIHGGGEKAILELFKAANKRIKSFNALLGINRDSVDFLTKDYAACVAAGALIREDNISYGFISDCGVSIFRPNNGDFVFVSENEGPDKHEKYIDMGRREAGCSDWRDSQARIVTRSIYRNNPSEPNSYGALTGQDEAVNYIKIGTKGIKKGDIVLLYSDGLTSIIEQGKSIDFLRKRNFNSLKKHCRNNVRKEGTLVYFIND